MPVDKIAVRSGTALIRRLLNAAGIQVDSADGKLKFNDYTGTAGVVRSVLTEGQSPAIVTLLANATLSALLHGNRTVLVSKIDGLTVTLPAATGSGIKYRLVIGITMTSSSFVVAVADASDYMRGFALLANDTDGSASNFETPNTGVLATEADTITMNRTTTGIATIGDCIELEDIATDIWSVHVKAQASGAEATPFSAAV